MIVLTLPLNPCDTVIGVSELQPVQLVTLPQGHGHGALVWPRPALLCTNIVRTGGVQRVTWQDGQHPILTLHPDWEPGTQPCLLPDGGELGQVLHDSEV